MSSFSIVSAARWLEELVVNEVEYLSEVRDKVQELQSELEWMQSFLIANADGMRFKNPLIWKRVSDISYLALEAEDITDTYILKVANKRRDGFVNRLKRAPYFCKDVRTLHKIGSQIDGVTAKIVKLTSRLKTYDVLDVTTARRSLADQMRTYSHTEPEFIVGIDQKVATLIQQLKENPQKIVVAHGMGGIGKTVLAGKVYKNCLSREHFVGCAWAYVSQQCNLGAVCKDLLNELLPKDGPGRDLIKGLEESQLPGKLYAFLKENNCLVILDDVWTVDDWKVLEPAFPIHESSCGSKIFVTTRNSHIVAHLGEYLVSTWKAEALDGETSWKLLENKGHFMKNDLDSLMKEVALKMLDHCKGHPLAIVALGGVLATQRSLEEWESVCENLQSHLQGDEESYSGVYEVLAMSYHALQYNLKPCFLHMAHFPEDFQIDVEKLYNLWIGDGVVSSKEDQFGTKTSLEDIVDSYLNQLFQKAMIQVDCKDKDYEGRISSCSLHDLTRDKCLEIIEKENFLQIMNIDKRQSVSANSRTDRIRRLTMYVGKDHDGQYVLNQLSGEGPSLRSLYFTSSYALHERKEDGCEWIKSICQKFKLLRTLDFESGVILRGRLPKEVGNLIHLRYLCLKGTYVTELPPSIRNLKSLLVLDIRVREVIKLPNVLWAMRFLRCLYFPERVLSQEPEYAFDRGYKIADGSLLILDNLSQLERLVEVDLDEVDVKGLVELTSMRKLTATCRRRKESLVPFLNSSSIKHLNLKIDASFLAGDSDMLLSNSRSLRILHIDTERDAPIYLPIRVGMFHCNLRELGFWYCLFEEDPMPILEKLPKLRNLQLRICYRGLEINCSATAFPELDFLSLDGLFYLKTWNVEKGGFPKLRAIEVYNSPIEKIPDALPRNIHVYCLPDLYQIVDEFHKRGTASEDNSGGLKFPLVRLYKLVAIALFLISLLPVLYFALA